MAVPTGGTSPSTVMSVDSTGWEAILGVYTGNRSGVVTDGNGGRTAWEWYL